MDENRENPWGEPMELPGEPAPPARPKRLVLYGSAVYLLSLPLLLFGGGLMQYHLGMTGLFLTEVMLAGVALLACVIGGIPLRRAFAFSRPQRGEIGASILLWLGAFCAIIAITQIQLVFFPSMQQHAQELGEVITGGGSLPINLFVVALMPAVCEEMLFRGFFFEAFQTIPQRKHAVLIVGVLFGLFHLDLYRLLSTGLLGIVLCYLVYRSGNILLPILIHFLNNAFSVIVSSLPTDLPTEPIEPVVYSLDASILISFLLFAALSWLLVRKGIRRFDRVAAGRWKDAPAQ